MRLSVIRPSATPKWWIIFSRSSSPGAPFGIFEKSPFPSAFCSPKVNAQWSVEIAESTSLRTASQSTSWFDASRTGGEKTYFAPSKPGCEMCDKSTKKYCVQVSPQTRQPERRARSIASTASLHVTWTTYSGARAIRASWIARFVASPSSSGGRVSAWYLGSVCPPASACLTRTSIASPFSACTMISAPVSAATSIVLKSVSSETWSTPL